LRKKVYNMEEKEEYIIFWSVTPCASIFVNPTFRMKLPVPFQGHLLMLVACSTLQIKMIRSSETSVDS
jgi:hypothetical protein